MVEELPPPASKGGIIADPQSEAGRAATDALLGEMDRYLRIGARLALEPPAAHRDRQRAEMAGLVNTKFGDDFALAISQVFAGVRELAVLERGFSQAVHRDRAAARRLLEYIGRGAGVVLAAGWPTWEGLTAITPQVERMLEDHRESMRTPRAPVSSPAKS